LTFSLNLVHIERINLPDAHVSEFFHGYESRREHCECHVGHIAAVLP
jgi:hypothetical protein